MEDALQEFLDGRDDHSPEDNADGVGLELDDQDSTGLPNEPEENVDDKSDDDPDKGNSPKDDEKKEESTPEEKPVEDAPDVTELKKRADEFEKRFRDTQASYTREHQARLDLEKRLAALEQSKAEQTKADDDWFDDGQPRDGKSAPDPVNAEIAELKQQLETMNRTQAEREWGRMEEQFKAGHDDYQELVYDVFQPEWEANEAVQKEYLEKGGTPEAAYEIAQRLKTRREFETDPDAYKARIREELKQELLKELKPRDDLPDTGDMNSRPPDKSGGGHQVDDVSPLDLALGNM